MSRSEVVLASDVRDENRLPARYAIGIVHYRSYEDLERCLASAESQTALPAALLVFDADSDLLRFGEMRGARPGVVWESGTNLGYAAGANLLLERIGQICPAADFMLLLNPDVVLEPDFAQNLLRAMRENPDVAIAGGKLLRPGGRILDSAGIRLPRHRRPRDRGSGQIDSGQYDRREFVFGASGAAMFLRRAALESLAIEGEVFDEDFFLYHEDTDLCWRANLLGWRVLYEPSARAIHARGWRREERFDVPVRVRRHSFKNHYLQLVKNETLGQIVIDLPVLLLWEIVRLAFALLRDRAVLPAYGDALRLMRRALHKRRILQRRARELASRPG